MCGIAGIVNLDDSEEPPSVEILSSMVSALKHRGPDEFGLYRDMHVGLAHARLSIVDLVSGQQPLANEDNSIWISFNGEIFNFVELRAELEELGHRFRTHSDTEVIVHAYEAWGVECFPRFNGQWAAAIWDTNKKELILSRDRIGVRPLFTFERAHRVWFASEVKAIFADPSVPRAIDIRGLDQTFTYWASIAPLTIFQGIEELRPGFTRIYSVNGSRRDIQFWRASYLNSEMSAYGTGEATELLREKLARASALRVLRSDVPVGSYLSGGLDSALIARLGRNAKEGTFQTFSIRFEDNEFDETPYQRRMSAALATDHEEILVRRGDIAEVFPDVIYHTERPILRTAPAPLFLLSRAVNKAGIKAVLTGEGADELLAGYDLFREEKIRRFWSRQPGSTLRPRLFEKLYPYLARSPQQTKGLAFQFWKQGLDSPQRPGFSHDLRWSTTETLKKFFSADTQHALALSPAPNYLETLPDDFHQWDSLAQAQFIEVETLLSSYLLSSQGDRMLMAHSVEGRFPFLDADVIAFCNSLRSQLKLNGLDEKFILKKVSEGLVPDEIIHRPKQPYRAPDAISFFGDGVPDYVSDLLSSRSIRESGIFDGDAVSGLYSKCRRRSIDGNSVFSNVDNMSVVGILSTQLVFDRFVATSPSVSHQQIQFKTFIDRTFVYS